MQIQLQGQTTKNPHAAGLSFEGFESWSTFKTGDYGHGNAFAISVGAAITTTWMTTGWWSNSPKTDARKIKDEW